MATTSQKVLIIGGGPAGATAAYWLAQAGYHITVAERSTDKFAYGQGIDVTGPAIQVVQKMGVYDQIKSKVTGEAGFAILNDQGNPIATLGTATNDKGKGLSLTQEIEIMRGDITQILADKAKESDRVTYRYGCTITELRQTDSHVTALFANTSGEPEAFSFVIGADGLMSRTRKMAFPPNMTETCYEGLDQYTAFFSLPHQPEDIPNARLQHAVRGRAVLIRPTSLTSPERSSCYMIDTGKSPALAKTLSAEEQKARFAERFGDFPGETGRRVLEGMWEAKDFYCAQSAQIKLPKWSQGRVVLVGDAACCPSPASGMGTVLAILGSYVLAGEIAASPGDLGAAFERYEERLRGFVERAQYIPLGGLLPKIGNPQSWVGVRAVRFVFWFIAWSGVWKLVNVKQGDGGFELPNYEFERC
jgi:2-polyprenyl-6-methoxyphenol hydroxylase-like FAD-dependent oxidoreductase